jgi:hypothetical protein
MLNIYLYIYISFCVIINSERWFPAQYPYTKAARVKVNSLSLGSTALTVTMTLNPFEPNNGALPNITVRKY